MKYAVIGTGYWGSNHVRVAAELASEGVIDDVVLCDVDEGRVKELADSYDVEFVTDYTSLETRGIDAATVATPSTTHRDIAVDLLASGIDLLVEKPLALTAEDAWHIVETAEINDRVLGAGHIFRYHPALIELKQRIDRGELGELKYLNTTRFSFRVPRATTGVLFQLAVHDVDIYTYLFGEQPDAIYCNLDSFVRDDIDETATLTLTFGDATGVINESWQVPVYGKRRDLTAIGTERAAYVDYLEDTTIEIHDASVTRGGDGYRSRVEGVQTYETERREPLRVEIESFLEACASGGQPRATGEVGAQTVELLEKARQSSESNSVVHLD